MVSTAIGSNRGLKKVHRQLSEGTRPLTAIRLPDGHLGHDQQSLLDEVQRFYNDLYRNTIPILASCTFHNAELMPLFLDCEIAKALGTMRAETALGEDGVRAEALKLAKQVLIGPLRKLFNDCLTCNQIPAGLADSKTILSTKKETLAPLQISTNFIAVDDLQDIHTCIGEPPGIVFGSCTTGRTSRILTWILDSRPYPDGE